MVRKGFLGSDDGGVGGGHGEAVPKRPKTTQGATKHSTIAAMLKALKFKDMETAQDALAHGGYKHDRFDFHDLLGCGCCSYGPSGVWHESWNADTGHATEMRKGKDITTYRYLSDSDYLLRLNPLFIDRS